MYKFNILKDVDVEKWDYNLSKSNYATFFQSSKFLKIQMKDKFPLFVNVVDDNDEIKGQLGLTIIKSQTTYSTKKLDKFTKLISKLGNRGTWVAGPIIFSNDEKIREEILQTFMIALDLIAKEYNLTIIDGYSPPQDLLVNKNYIEEFKKKGYQTEKFLTYATNLDKSLEEIWKKIAKKARNDVTRAKRREITIKELEKFDDFIEFRALMRKWAETKGIELSENPEAAKIDWEYHKHGVQRFFLAYQDNEIISGLRVGCFNNIAYTHQVLSTYSKTTSLGGSLLTWHAIEWAKNNGFNTYDFSGIKSAPENEKELEKYNEQWLGLEEYKKKWGGNEFPYYHFVKMKKQSSYKLFRLLSRPDFIYREYKRKRFKRPIKSSKSDNRRNFQQ